MTFFNPILFFFLLQKFQTTIRYYNMTDKILIKNTSYADSRTAPEDITKEKLYDATVEHISDVQKAMDYFGKKLHEAGLKHDFTKMSYFDEYAENVLSEHTDEEFKNWPWYQRHVYEERHHVNDNAHSDVDLVDIIEHLVDVVMSGLGRAGFVNSKYADISPDLLYRAYWNSVHKLENIVEISNAEDVE